MTDYHCMFILIHSFIPSFIHSAMFWVACGISTQDPWLDVEEQVRVDICAPSRVVASMCPRTHRIPLCSILSRGAFLAWGSSSPRWACIPLFTNFSPGALGRNRGQRSE